MALSDADLWANQNPPSGTLTSNSTQAQNDVANGIQCGQPISPDGINFALAKYSRCLQGELQNFVGLSSIAYNPNDPTNLADAFRDIFCTWLSDFIFAQNATGTGTLSITLPPGSSWCVIVNYIGGGDSPPFTFGTSAGSTVPVLFLDQGENVVSGGNALTLAGGQTVSVAQTAGVSGVLTVKAFNLDCPV